MILNKTYFISINSSLNKENINQVLNIKFYSNKTNSFKI